MTSVSRLRPERVLGPLQAISDETRLKVLQILTGGERCVCQLTASLDVSQPLLSHHLKTLREAGLVRGRKQGRWMYYTLDRDALAAVRNAVDGLLSAYEESARLGRPGCEC